MNKRFLLLICAMVLAISPAFAQFKIAGVVTDSKDGSPIAFASVVVKGTTTGVAADVDGKYVITAPNSDATLVFSSIGFATQEIEVKGKGTINVVLGPDAEALDEVMVVAYGTATKTAFTGSAGKVSGEKIELVPSTNPLNTLNGTTPGLRLTNASGQPGEDATITVRGIGSLNGNTDPLIVVDGMIFSGLLSSIPSSDIEQITVLKDAASTALYGSRAANGVIMITTKQGKGEKPVITVKISHGWVTREQKDYEMMNVDQFSESYWRQIYNDQIANNQLLSEAKAGKTPIDPAKAAEEASANLMSNFGYSDSYMPYRGDGVTSTNVVGTDGKLNPNAKYIFGNDNDWMGQSERVGHVQDYGISASGKGKYTSYFGSVNYLNNQGYMIGTGYERYSARANVSFQKEWLKFGVNLSASLNDQTGNLSTSAGGTNNPVYFSLRVTPYYTVHRHYADGSYVYNDAGQMRYDFGEGYTWTEGSNVYSIPQRVAFKGNVVNYQEARASSVRRNIINVKPYIEVTFLKDFKASVNASLYNNNYKSHTATPYYPDQTSSSASSCSATQTFINAQTWTLNQLLSWNHNFGDHHVDALLGHETYKYVYENESSSKKNQIMVGDNYEFNNYILVGDVPSSYKNTYNTEGYFARVNYDYASKYFFSASFRRDGTSKFASESRWGNFWSVGGSWLISNEKWMKEADWVDMLKLRASIGTVGSDDLGAYYPYMALYNRALNDQEAGYTQSLTYPGAPNLQWEVSTNWDVAAEFAFFKRRLTGTIEYFHRMTTNLLMDVTLAPSTGLTSYPSNEGGLLNQGVELSLAGDIIRTKNVTWNLGVNASFIQNKITYLPIPPYLKNSSHNRVEEGHSVHEWWLYQWAGVNPATGLNYYELGSGFYNEDGSLKDGVLSKKDVVVIDGLPYTTDIAQAKEDYSGSPIPKVYGGINTDLKLWRFNLSLNLYYQLGGQTYDRGYSNTMQQGIVGDTSPYQNRNVDALRAWTAPGDITDVAMFTSSTAKIGSSTYSANVAAARSTRWLVSTNMLEINNLMLSYDFSKKFCDSIKIHGLKVYASADHLAVLNCRRGTYTNYSLSNYTSHGAGAIKPARTISIGLNFSL